MNKERLFYLDFIRAISTIIIVLTHYNALFLYNVNSPKLKNAVISLYVGNIYIGAFGVSLFLIISGASLMYVYGKAEKFDYKKFYFKRAKTIYPMFWITFILFSFYNIYIYGFNTSVPRKNIIFSILGIDGYILNYGVKTFYICGEWFLGFIILFYLLFPLLLFLINKFPKTLAVSTMAIYIVACILNAKSISIFIRLPELVFGMYFIKYIKNIKWYVALSSMTIIVVNYFIKPGISENIQTTYIGISAFLVFVYISKFCTWNLFKKICSTICKYSFVCFLTHHYIIYQMMTRLDLNNMSRTSSYLLFVCCCIVIALVSYFIYHLHEKIMKYITDK